MSAQRFYLAAWVHDVIFKILTSDFDYRYGYGHSKLCEGHSLEEFVAARVDYLCSKNVVHDMTKFGTWYAANRDNNDVNPRAELYETWSPIFYECFPSLAGLEDAGELSCEFAPRLFALYGVNVLPAHV